MFHHRVEVFEPLGVANTETYRIEFRPITDHIQTMRTLRISQDIVPLGEFKGQAAHWLKRANETDQPVVITQNGKPAAVLLSPAEYDRLQERQRFLESITAGLDDAADGRSMTTAELKSRLAARRRKRPAA